MQMVDLCCGIGTFSTAAECLNIEVVSAIDNCPYAQVIYNQNHSSIMTHTDILDLKPSDIPAHDILCAGFPCQPFSKMGHRKGTKDKRYIFPKILELISYHKPQYVVLENVKNLLYLQKGSIFNTINQSLGNEGYIVSHKVLDTHKLTATPQHRERLYIVAAPRSISLDFPSIAHKKITELLQTNVPNKYYYTARYKCFNEVLSFCTNDVHETGAVYYFAHNLRLFKKPYVSPTLTRSCGWGGHKVPIIKCRKKIRKLTPRECLRLQGFPDSFGFNVPDKHIYAACGNACSLGVVKLVIQAIKDDCIRNECI